MLEVSSPTDVFRIIRDHFATYPLESETVDIDEAVGRITAETITALENIPDFHRSSVDGYAVTASDTFGAGESMPAQLQWAGEVRMGEIPAFELQKGQAASIPTGGELPENADAVVMVEYTEDYQDGFIYVHKPVSPGHSVVFRGDDVAAGDAVISANKRLRPQDIGILAALGFEKINVKRKIKVGIISSGNEIVPAAVKPNRSQVRDVNSHALFAGLKSCGAEPVLYGIAADDFEAIKSLVSRALEECDVVLVSGGSSVGTRDETLNVIKDLKDSTVLVHGIAVKPGKPTIFGKVGNKAVVGLPGHPASALMIFQIFVVDLLSVMAGAVAGFESDVKAVMKSNYPSNNGREEYLPVKLEREKEEIRVSPVYGKSGLMTLLSAADGYVHIERGSEGLSRGECVRVRLFR